MHAARPSRTSVVHLQPLHSRFLELVGLHALLQLQQPLAICGGHDVARHQMVPAVVIATRLPPPCALIRLQGHCVPGKDGATRTIDLEL